MGQERCVYRVLLARMAAVGMRKQQAARLLGISEGSMYNKLYARTPFTLDEAIGLKQLLGVTGELEDLFLKEANTANESKEEFE